MVTAEMISAIAGQEAARIATRAPVRQAILSGVRSSGVPAFLTWVSDTAITLEASATEPFVVSFAAGFDLACGAPLDYHAVYVADQASAWTGLATTNNGARYLYLDRDATTGAVTFGSSLYKPAYAAVAPGSPATDQHWFDIVAYIMYRYSGSAWVAFQRVFVGESRATRSADEATTGNTVSASMNNPTYAFNDSYSSNADSSVTGGSVTGVCYVGQNFGSAKTVSRVHLVQLSLYPVSSVKVQSSTDGAAWTDRGTFDVGEGFNVLDVSYYAAEQYFRVLANAAPYSAWAVNEVEFFTRATPYTVTPYAVGAVVDFAEVALTAYGVATAFEHNMGTDVLDVACQMKVGSGWQRPMTAISAPSWDHRSMFFSLLGLPNYGKARATVRRLF